MKLPFGLRPVLYVPVESMFLGVHLIRVKSQVMGYSSIISYFSDSEIWTSRKKHFSVVSVLTLNIEDLDGSVGYQPLEDRLVTVFEEGFAADLANLLFAMTDENPQAFFAHPWEEELAAIKPFADWISPDYIILRVMETVDGESLEIESMVFDVEAYREYELDWKKQPRDFLISISNAGADFLKRSETQS